MGALHSKELPLPYVETFTELYSCIGFTVQSQLNVFCSLTNSPLRARLAVVHTAFIGKLFQGGTGGEIL